MTVLFAIVLVAHGLIHLLGFVKAFGLVQVPQLTQPIAPAFGVLWLIAALLFVATSALLFLWPRGWWMAGAAAVAVSTILVGLFWTDAKFGTVGNLLVGIGVIFGFLAQGPFSLRAAYDRDVDRALDSTAATQLLTEADLALPPSPLQQYLRAVGVVGQPRVHNFRVRMHGRIRSGPSASWIPFSAEQYNFVDQPARFFYLQGTMFMVPVQGYHRYSGPSATMTVKAAALVPVAKAAGSEMDTGETVTMFNDMCVMAPATLISPAIQWVAVDARVVRATFTNAGHTIRAELLFNEAGELTNFWSDDRFQTTPDGRARRLRWSTPVGGYRQFGALRLPAQGEGRWHEPSGEYAYIELTIDDVGVNIGPRRPS